MYPSSVIFVLLPGNRIVKTELPSNELLLAAVPPPVTGPINPDNFYHFCCDYQQMARTNYRLLRNAKDGRVMRWVTTDPTFDEPYMNSLTSYGSIITNPCRFTLEYHSSTDLANKDLRFLLKDYTGTYIYFDDIANTNPAYDFKSAPNLNSFPYTARYVWKPSFPGIVENGRKYYMRTYQGKYFKMNAPGTTTYIQGPTGVHNSTSGEARYIMFESVPNKPTYYYIRTPGEGYLGYYVDEANGNTPVLNVHASAAGNNWVQWEILPTIQTMPNQPNNLYLYTIRNWFADYYLKAGSGMNCEFASWTIPLGESHMWEINPVNFANKVWETI